MYPKGKESRCTCDRETPGYSPLCSYCKEQERRRDRDRKKSLFEHDPPEDPCAFGYE